MMWKRAKRRFHYSTSCRQTRKEKTPVESPTSSSVSSCSSSNIMVEGVTVAKSILRGSVIHQNDVDLRKEVIILDYSCSEYGSCSCSISSTPTRTCDALQDPQCEILRKQTTCETMDTMDDEMEYSSVTSSDSDDTGQEEDYDECLLAPEEPCCNDDLEPSSSYQEDSRILVKLEEKFPNSTKSERLRFLQAFGPSTTCETMLGAYIEFRQKYSLDEQKHSCTNNMPNDDAADWKYAWQTVWDTYEQNPDETLLFPQALHCHGHHEHDNSVESDRKDGQQEHQHHLKHNTDNKKKLYQRTHIPQYLFVYNDEGQSTNNISCSTDGKDCMLVHILPMQIYIHEASPEMHTLAVALYMERKLSRNNNQQFRILLDVKAGPGCRNPKPLQLLNFILTSSKRLDLLWASRCEQVFIYPAPRIVVMLWNLFVKNFLPTIVSERGRLISGQLPGVSEKTWQSMVKTRQHLIDVARKK